MSATCLTNNKGPSDWSVEHYSEDLRSKELFNTIREALESLEVGDLGDHDLGDRVWRIRRPLTLKDRPQDSPPFKSGPVSRTLRVSVGKGRIGSLGGLSDSYSMRHPCKWLCGEYTHWIEPGGLKGITTTLKNE
jgi:hypothetical protein